MSIFRILALVFFLSVAAPSMAQQSSLSYAITNTAGVQNLQSYTDALSKCDLDRYRFKSKSNIIRFDNGITVEIYSAEWCVLHSVAVKTDRLRDDTRPYEDGIFTLAPNGMIVEKKSYNAKSR